MMLKKLAPIIVVVVAAGLGGGGGVFLKTQSASEAHSDQNAAEHSDEMLPAAHDAGVNKENKKDKKSKGHGEEAVAASSVFSFGRQFVVPIIKDGRPELMILLDIGVEIDSSVAESAYSREPMLRDAMLTEMLALSSRGILGEIATDENALQAMKDALLAPAKTYLGDGATRILVLEMAVQPY